MVIVFDLDDTLYEEMTFVLSGFLVVSQYIEKNYSIKSDDILEILKKELFISRNYVFDRTFKHFGIYSKKLVKKSLSIYRNHFPNLVLYEEAVTCLNRFKGYPLYIVTDGNVLVQKNKLLSLNLYNKPPIKKCLLTHRYGLKNSKPSPYCLLKISHIEKVSPEKIIYVGDNPQKDFVGIKPLGFKTVRVLTGQHKELKKTNEFEAHINIKNLNYLTEELITSLIS